MTEPHPPSDAPHPHRGLTRERIAEICGEISDAQTAALLALGVSEAELEEAVAWIAGEDDVLGDERRPFTGRVAAAYDVLTADEEPEEERRA